MKAARVAGAGSRRAGRMIGEAAGQMLSGVLDPQAALGLRLRAFQIRAAALERLGVPCRLWLGPRLERLAFRHVRWIDPGDIRHVTKSGVVPFLESGDWDLHCRPFELHPTIVEMYVNDRPYQETAQYVRMRARIDAGHAAYWCRTHEDVDRYFQILASACDEIRQGRYRAQAPSEAGTGEARYPNEIIVSIGRDGEYLQERGGTHRLSAAKLFGLPQVPVVVLRRHVQYAQRTGDWGQVSGYAPC